MSDESEDVNELLRLLREILAEMRIMRAQMQELIGAENNNKELQ